jgi:thymidylate synthase (FAD)
MNNLINKGNYKDFRSRLKVELVNPEVVRDYLRFTGEFASVCYNTDTGLISPESIAKHCIDSGHWSPARATYFVFKVTGMSRACSHQVVRHSIGVQINQRSQRYCDESMPMIIIPNSIAAIPDALDEYLACVSQCYITYGRLKNVHGIPGEDARMVLQNCTETEMNIAFTPQALEHFCNERCCTRASDEINAMAWQCAHEVSHIENYFKKRLVPKCESLGYCPEKKSCGRLPVRNEVLGAYERELVSKLVGNFDSDHVCYVNVNGIAKTEFKNGRKHESTNERKHESTNERKHEPWEDNKI